MKKYVNTIICIAFVAIGAACSQPGELLPTAAGISPGHSFALPLAGRGAAEVTSLLATPLRGNPRSVEPNTTSEPDIPVIVDEIYLGVPAGNGHRPQHVAVDSQEGRAYTLNTGTKSTGNTISVLDLRSGEVVHLIALNNQRNQDALLPNPLDLQLDPYRPRLYALWGDRFAETTDSTLSIIDTDTLNILDTVPDVEAVAPGPDRLYLANDTRLWSVDPDTLADLTSRDLDPRQFNEPLLLNPQANRLYLGRGRPWSLEVFEGETLAPVNSYPMPGQMTHAVVDVAGERLFILENDGAGIALRALDADGDALASPAPVPLTDNIYSNLPLAFDGQTFYTAGSDVYDYRLDAYSLPNLALSDSLPLWSQPYDLDVDPVTGIVYAPYSSWSNYVLAIDPSSGQAETTYTARTILGALADPAQGRLYALDDGGLLHVLNLDDYSPIARVGTGFHILKDRRPGYGQLSLDPGRNRLYIGGDPVRIVDTDTLEVVAQVDGRGQITPDPTGDRLYLTPPCECRMEQCNTLILSAETLTGTQTIFPPQDPLTAPCVVTTRLDPDNQLLYATIYNGIPGSNSGDYYTIFDVSDQPQELFTAFDISFGDVALDPPNARAFAPRYRINRSFIHRFDAQADTVTQTLTLVGAHGQLVYDPDNDRLYAVQKDALSVFDGELSLLVETSLPEDFGPLTFDPGGQRLYLGDADGTVLILSTGGGELEPPPPAETSTDRPQIRLIRPAPDDTLFGIYDLRLYRSRDGGQNWELLGTGLPGRPVGDLAISPDYERDGSLLAGLWDFGFGGGLYRSTDGGDTWRPTTRGLTDLEIQQIAFSPTFSRDETIFLTTIDHGLFRSSDGGDTWASLAANYAADEYDRQVDHLAVSPTFADDNLVIISKRHLLRSTDGGQSWIDTYVPGGLAAFSPDFANDGLVLNSGHWRSTDGGQTWQPSAVGRELGTAQDIFFSPAFADDQTVYLLLQPETDTGLSLQRSVDAGRSWESLLGGLPAGFELAWAAILPEGDLYLTAPDGSGITTGADELEWGRPAIDITQLELQSLAIAPDGPLYVANSGAGVFKSMDGGRTWTEPDFPARADPVLHPARLAVAEDGTLFATAGTVAARSTDDGETWTYLDGLPPGFEMAALSISPSFAEDGIVVVGGNYRNNQILRSADGGQSWETVFDAAATDIEYAADLSALAFSPDFARDGTLYAWLQEGGLLRSGDGGLTWELASESEYYGQTLALSPSGERLFLGALDGHALVSEDSGRNWIDLRDNIPDDRVWSTDLAFGDDGSLFLATDRGVYRSPDGGETWAPASDGLPLHPTDRTPQSVRALRFHDGRLYAALVQGGLYVSDDLGESWRSSLAEPPAAPARPSPSPTPVAQASDGIRRQPTSSPPPLITAADCPVPDHSADLWTGRVAQLGCPVISYSLPVAEQSFEGGWMYWRSDTREILVFIRGQLYAQVFADTWDEAQPAYSCPSLAPSQTPPTPQRGFGKVWCNESMMRQLLGDATSGERLFDATVQEFDSGFILETDQGVRYVLESRSGAWERVE